MGAYEMKHDWTLMPAEMPLEQQYALALVTTLAIINQYEGPLPLEEAQRRLASATAKCHMLLMEQQAEGASRA